MGGSLFYASMGPQTIARMGAIPSRISRKQKCSLYQGSIVECKGDKESVWLSQSLVLT